MCAPPVGLMNGPSASAKDCSSMGFDYSKLSKTGKVASVYSYSAVFTLLDVEEVFSFVVFRRAGACLSNSGLPFSLPI